MKVPSNRLPEHCADYVNHMVRFYISTPDGISVQDHTTAEVNNWIAVQSVLCDLDQPQQQFLTDVYSRRVLRFSDAVKVCCRTHNMDERDAWKLIDLVSSRMARVRGLV